MRAQTKLGLAPNCNRCRICHFVRATKLQQGVVEHKEKDTADRQRMWLIAYQMQPRLYAVSRTEPVSTFDVIIRMDWLVERDAVIVCGKKEVHVPYKNKTLVVKGDSGASRLKVISCIKARKYIEKGSQLFLAQVTEKEPLKKQLQDVPVIRKFLEVFLDDFPRLPLPRQVEFRIELVPGGAPVARAPYRLAPSELKELSDQLKELL
ncbi:hypothetical protein Tco_0726607 [Tanacetum coccineum]|uniref:Reverse transcriptase domain-containing protein n=1 Tax=Tanacetum coccineum TaxID=301880 RepID=A0ABQ4YIB9_9ASTR